MSAPLRMHDFAEPGEPLPQKLEKRSARTPRKDELFSQLLDAADRFLSATRSERREAEERLLKAVDRVKARMR